MSGDIIGRAVNAVLLPPQAERFASLVGTDTGRLVLNVSGWNKPVLMDFDRVFLFPRSAIGVEWFERELAAYRALAGARLSVVPRLLGRWEDQEIYPFRSQPSPACEVRRRLPRRISSSSWAGPSPAGMNWSRRCWPGRGPRVTTTPLGIVG